MLPIEHRARPAMLTVAMEKTVAGRLELDVWLPTLMVLRRDAFSSAGEGEGADGAGAAEHQH
jgi:hypothetical protein